MSTNEVNGTSPSFNPPTRNVPIGLSLSLNTSPSLRPPTSNRPRASILPTLSIKTDPPPVPINSTVQLTPSISDDSSPSPAIIEKDFGRQVRECIGDESNENNTISGAFERMNISTSADGDDEATPPPPQDALTEEIGSMDEDGWRKAAREGGIVELSILGEGSSGSVSRCRLRHGTQEFALKVCTSPGKKTFVDVFRLYLRIHRCRDRSCENCRSIDLVIQLTSYGIIPRFLPLIHRRLRFVWNIVLGDRWIMCINRSRVEEDGQESEF